MIKLYLSSELYLHRYLATNKRDLNIQRNKLRVIRQEVRANYISHNTNHKQMKMMLGWSLCCSYLIAVVLMMSANLPM